MRPLIAVLVLLFCVGCSSVQKPSVTVRSMSLGDINLQGFTMNFAVDVENPNTFELPMTNLDYGLSLAGSKVLEGAAKPEGAVPANGKRAVSLPVTVSFEKVLSAADALKKLGGDVPYTLDGGFDFGGDIALLRQPVRVPVTYAGTIKFKELLKDPLLLLRSPAAQKLAEKLLGGLLK